MKEGVSNETLFLYLSLKNSKNALDTFFRRAYNNNTRLHFYGSEQYVLPFLKGE